MILTNDKLYTFAYSNTVDNFNDEISKFNKSLNSFELPSQNSIIIESTEEEGGGCLIATATYGSELALQVQQLRELRDNQLLQTESGKQFMIIFNDVYYSFSPIIADYERENPLFKEAVKLAITPMISTLSLMENAESESEVLGIGISVIMLNLGMYMGVPAIVIVGIRKIF
jgi:peptidyl-prolyl cis-trans isomerase B (cyclophilin B)